MTALCNVIMIMAIVAAVISVVVLIVLKTKAKRIKGALLALVCSVAIAAGAGITSYVVSWTNGETGGPQGDIVVTKKSESEMTCEFTSWEECADSVFEDFSVDTNFGQSMITVSEKTNMTQEQTQEYMKACKEMVQLVEEYGDGADRLPALNGALLKWGKGSILVSYSLSNTPHASTKLLNDNNFKDTEELYKKYFN